MKFRDFPKFDETTAAVEAREALAQSKRAFGAIPAPLARYASSPSMLTFTLSGLHGFEKSALPPLEREVLAMTMGRLNGCRLCLDMHRRLLAAQQAPADLIAALEAGQALSDRRLEALRSFVLALVEHHGDVPERVWTDFREAGYTHQQALELVMGVGVYTITTLANRLTETSE
jgi:AhpD family alkylhydroperoxidase